MCLVTVVPACRFNYSPTGVWKVRTPLETVDGVEEEGDGRPDFEAVAGGEGTLDKELEASGFTRKNQEVLEQVSAFGYLNKLQVLQMYDNSVTSLDTFFGLCWQSVPGFLIVSVRCCIQFYSGNLAAGKCYFALTNV